MPLETGTYVSDLTTTNPPGTDQRKQGDDHLRLIKSVLKTTFPNASKTFYFPDYAAKTTTYTILSTEQNKYFGCATAGGAWTITLPALVAGDAGWSTIIFKTDVSQNGLTIAPSAGTINGETSLRLSQIYDAVRVLWSGTVWTAIPIKSALRIRSITADITVAEADLDSLILCTPAANTTITLPAVANYIGRMLAITHIPSGAFTTTLDGNAAETVDGAATKVLPTTRSSVILIATTTGWEVVGGAALSASTTTEQLTGTSTTKAATPDSVAALWEAGADITDGATITIGEGGYFNLTTSTAAITSFNIPTDKAGRSFKVRFDTARTLTHNAISLILPGGANITTAVGDIAFVRSLGGGNVVVEAYTKASGATLGVNRLALAANVSNSTLNFADVTALSFAVTSGVKYKFKFTIVYDVPAVTTGAAWSINGPTTTRLTFQAPVGVATAYDTPATPTSSSSFATSNRVEIEGIVQPSANGTVIARFKSEVDTSAVTAIAGVSFVEWEVIN